MMDLMKKETGEKLVSWFHENKREMAWRESPTPYHVYVSEIMLQQTRVEAVREYYRRFLEALPDFEALSKVDDDALLKLWEGLGYYSRVRNMKKTAQEIMTSFSGEMPKTRAELLRLPGIGSYTAGAILSIAYHLPEPLVDGNVLRVLSRLFCSEKDIALDETKKEFETMLGVFLKENDLDPSAFNQALMELGAIVCVPNGAPKCDECPWNRECKAFLQNETEKIPVKSPKKARKQVQKTVLFLKEKDALLVVKNSEKGLLSGLYAYPMIDGTVKETETLKKVAEYLGTSEGLEISEVKRLPKKKHIFTHIEWQMEGLLVEVRGLSSSLSRTTLKDRARLCSFQEIKESIPMASALKKWDEILGEL